MLDIEFEVSSILIDPVFTVLPVNLSKITSDEPPKLIELIVVPSGRFIEIFDGSEEE